MIFFPAIDIQEGKCVRLQRGLLSNLKVYNEDPIEQAILFKSLGCEWIHVVDIDAAFTGAPKIMNRSLKSRNMLSVEFS